MPPSTVVFVHGWSVQSTDTYGELPERLLSEAKKRKWPLRVRHVLLGKYVSFRDEVTIDDIARGFDHAVRTVLADVLEQKERFACITHSTGGPVVRQWWHRYYIKPSAPETPCPMSHLIMLAPANFGSALAVLGKTRVSRLRAWFQDAEPGTGVLDWLELGSPESWDLNRAWIRLKKDFAATNGVFPFVLTGQTIDRKLYDHVNAYTGEPGSDGVVRATAANINATYLRLVQRSDDGATSELEPDEVSTAPDTAFKIVAGVAHSGADIGILRSVKDDDAAHPTVTATLRCLEVDSAKAYERLSGEFDEENKATQRLERVDVVQRRLIPDQEYIIDQFSMAIFLVRDDQGNDIGEFDLKLTAIPARAPERVKASPDLLPKGFLQDRQRNRRKGTLTFYFNQDVMVGCDPVVHPKDGRILRLAEPGLSALGLVIEPYLHEGFVHFVKGEREADKTLIRRILKPNQTTLVEIVMRRVVREGIMRLTPLDKRNDASFVKTPTGKPVP